MKELFAQIDLHKVLAVLVVILGSVIFLILFLGTYLDRNKELEKNIIDDAYGKGTYDYEDIKDKSTAEYLHEKLEEGNRNIETEEDNFQEFDR